MLRNGLDTWNDFSSIVYYKCIKRGGISESIAGVRVDTMGFMYQHFRFRRQDRR
jgi:hypothetical protein